MDPKDKDRQQARPLVSALTQLKGRVSFHMPGHRRGLDLPQAPDGCLSLLDTTELERSGDLAAPDGHVQEAYRLASDFFGAGQSWIITSGTTTSIHIMLASLLREGDQIIMPRAVHMAAVHAVAVLGLEPLFPQPEEGGVFEDGQPTAEAFIRAIRQYPGAKACYVTCPDYFGRTLDLAAIAREAQAAGMDLLVDEAHGAHFAAAPGLLPPTALSQGAAVVCQSAHKTLPALTPASFLHLSREAMDRGLVDPDRVAAMVSVFQTSSPSFLIAASADAARSAAAVRGRQAMEELTDRNRWLCDQLPPFYQRLLPPGADPSRLVLDYSASGRDRRFLGRHLDGAGIDAELIDWTRAVFIAGFDQPEEDYQRLLEALCSLEPQADTDLFEETRARNRTLSAERDRLLSQAAAFAIAPRQALFGRQTIQKLARQALVPYPPGLPILWPGEVIQEGHRHFLRELEAEGIVIRGISSLLSGGLS